MSKRTTAGAEVNGSEPFAGATGSATWDRLWIAVGRVSVHIWVAKALLEVSDMIVSRLPLHWFLYGLAVSVCMSILSFIAWATGFGWAIEFVLAVRAIRRERKSLNAGTER